MAAQIHRSTITDWMVRLHVAIQAFDHKLFAELSSRMGAEMLPIDDGAPEATCAFAVLFFHGKSDGTNGSIWSRSKHFVMEVTSSFCHPIVLEVAPLPRCSRSARSTTGLFPISCPWTEVRPLTPANFRTSR